MSETFRTTRLVEFHDTDMAGIMHFASFFHYMESAEHEMVRALGYSIHGKVDGQLLSFPRVSVACDFISPARSEDVLDIEIAVSRLGNKSITYQFHFSHEGRDVAKGHMTCACCRVEPGQPIVAVPLPDEIREKLSRYLVDGSVQH